MQFIWLPKAIAIAERVLSELYMDWVDTLSVQSINIFGLQQVWVIMLATWAIEWLQSWMLHRRTIRNFTHQAWATRDCSNHDLFWIIPNPGSQTRIALWLESIGTIPFQARASDVKMPKLGQYSSNWGMPCFINMFGTFQEIWILPDRDPGVRIRLPVDIIWMLPNLRYRSPACSSPKTVVNSGWFDTHMAATRVARTGGWSFISHNKSPIFISLRIQWPTESARRTSATLRCAWNGRCANTCCTHLKISL